MQNSPLTIYVTQRAFEIEVFKECPHSYLDRGLVISKNSSHPSVWAQDIWYNVQKTSFAELKKNPQQLLSLTKNWHYYPGCSQELRKLTQEIIPLKNESRIEFGKPLPKKDFGVLAVFSPETIFYSTHTLKPYPLGIMEFVEDKKTPPNRAYLKLWEIFTLTQRFPQPHETCLDLGASPGGWSWVISTFKSQVKAVDKSPLDGRIAKIKNITFEQGSAFSVQPIHLEPVDWIFSDVICYPARLLTFIKRWLASGKVKNMICTIKLQGDTDMSIIEEFKNLPNSSLLHLYHNKHELTWVYPACEKLNFIQN